VGVRVDGGRRGGGEIQGGRRRGGCTVPVDLRSSRRLSLSASAPFPRESDDLLFSDLALGTDLECTCAGISSPIAAAAAAAASRSLQTQASHKESGVFGQRNS
jgi:hypothetical protein